MKKNINLSLILNSVCNHYDIKKDLIISRNRKNHIIIARQMYCYFAKKYTNNNYRQIGEFIERDRSTVMFSIDKIKEQKRIYPSLKKQYKKIKKKLLEPKLVVNNIDLLEIAKKNTEIQNLIY